MKSISMIFRHLKKTFNLFSFRYCVLNIFVIYLLKKSESKTEHLN